jgi:hypothetical protein
LDRDFSKAISIMWNRKDRRQLKTLHDDLMSSLIGHRLQRLHDMSVMAFAFNGIYKGERGSIAAVKWFADDGFVAGSDPPPFSQLAISCMRSFAPTRLPTPQQLAKAREFWASVRRELTKEGNHLLPKASFRRCDHDATPKREQLVTMRLEQFKEYLRAIGRSGSGAGRAA